MIILTKEEKERKIKIAMLIIICYTELIRKDKRPLVFISYLSEIAMWVYEIAKISRIKPYESGCTKIN